MKNLTVALFVLVVMGMVSTFGAFAETKRPFAGVYGSIGHHVSSGEFSVSHSGPKFSFGKILGVPMAGSITTYEIGYRFPVMQSNVRLGINAILHEGSIAGAKTWNGFKSSATFGVSSNLRLSLGAEVGTVVGEQKRLYLFAGAGLVATDLTAGLSIDTPWGGWAREKSGGALGTIYRVGMQYQVNNHLSIGLSASQMQFSADKAFGLGTMGEQRFEATLEQTMFGLTASFRF